MARGKSACGQRSGPDTVRGIQQAVSQRWKERRWIMPVPCSKSSRLTCNTTLGPYCGSRGPTFPASLTPPTLIVTYPASFYSYFFPFLKHARSVSGSGLTSAVPSANTTLLPHMHTAHRSLSSGPSSEMPSSATLPGIVIPCSVTIYLLYFGFSMWCTLLPGVLPLLTC